MRPPLWAEEGRYPTPAEWVDWFTTLDRDAQLKAAEKVVADNQDALQCFMQNHAGELDYLRQWRALALASPRRAEV